MFNILDAFQDPVEYTVQLSCAVRLTTLSLCSMCSS